MKTWIAASWFVATALTAPFAGAALGEHILGREHVRGPAWRAQILDPLAPVQAYTTADPIDPDRLGLATPDGRFAIRPVQGCDWLAPYQLILTYPNWQMPPWLGLSGTDSVQPGCVVRVEGRMSTTPCFTDDAGACDVTQEFD